MPHSKRRLFRVLLGAGAALLILSGVLLANHFYGHGGSTPARTTSSLPAALSPAAPAATDPSADPAAPDGATGTPAGPRTAADRPGVPVEILVPSHGLRARVTADPLRPDGYVYVPRDPRVVSWTSGTGSAEYSRPGSNRGTAMLVSHINYGGVAGAFHDLATYQPGQRITLVLQDGRHLEYSVVGKPVLVKKSQLDADLTVPGEPLHHQLFDQTSRFGRPGTPLSGRLLLQSCGGAFDNRDGSYEDNVFVFALPTGSPAE